MQKREFWISSFWAAALGTVLSVAGTGCVITAFGLDAGSIWKIGFVGLVISAAAAVAFRFKWGGAALLGALALITGFLWRQGDAVEQTVGVLEKISIVYDKAYHWGYLALPGGGGGAFYPMAAVAVLVALAVSFTVTRGISCFMAVSVSILPVLSCLVVTDTIPEEGYLFLLLLGIGMLVFTSPVRRQAAQQSNTLSAMVLLPMILALTVLFLMNPKEDYVNQAGEFQANALQWLQKIPQRLQELPQIMEEMTAGEGLELPEDQKSSVDLRAVGPMDQSGYEVMDVFGTVEGTLYLRGQDFDFYSGTGWTSTARPGERFPADAAVLRNGGAVTIETRRLRDVLYLPYYPGGQESLISGRASNVRELKRYMFTVGKLREGWQDQSFGAPDVTLTAAQRRSEEQARQLYLSLDAQTRERALKILQPILQGQQSRTQQANAIAQFVRNSAVYDLNTPKMPGDQKDFALWFLEESDTGYCVHFASATAVLLRAAGIPARYVTGYMTQVTSGQTVTVTAAQAHAWVEYYEPVLDCWILLESTPSSGGQEGLETQPDPSGQIPDLETTAPAETEPTQTPTETEPEETQPEETPEEPSRTGHLTAILGWLLGAAGLMAAVVVQRVVRLRLLERQLSEGDANPLALRRWREAVRLSRLLGKKRPPRELEKLAQKAKYSQHTLTEEELAQLLAYLEACRDTLAQKGWFRQLLYRFVYVIY